jgi:CubicO group peptidase (beta-lactamase class C family)
MKVLAWVLGVVAVLLGVVIGALLYFRIPSNASGIAAKSVCSAAFVAGRPADRDLMAEDVLPASGVLAVVSTDVDTAQHSVTATFLKLFPRTASLVAGRGCVLDLPPDPKAQPYQPQAPTGAWPAGDTQLPAAQRPASVDSDALEAAVDAALVGAGDPAGANARGVAVVQGGRLLVLREAPGFEDATALHGWSMTKTLTGMLAYAIMADKGLTVDTKVVDAFPQGHAPAWVDDWRADQRRDITLGHLLRMLDGLENTESYDPWGAVPQMLYGEPDMAGWAAGHPSEAPPGSRFRYLSATTNILSEVLRAQFATDAEYWAYPKRAIFDRMGLSSATLETDTAGTWVGSSYLWASIGDWARLGQMMLDDGRWRGQQILPRGWWDLAAEPALPQGEGRGYGATAWRLGDPESGDCRANPDVPADTLAMEGHWGQIVAMVPSKDAVVARLGWTTNSEAYDECAFLGSVLAALPESGAAR